MTLNMRKLLVVSAALVSLAASAPAPAAAAPRMEVALQDDLLFLYRGAWYGEYMTRETGFQKMRAFQGSTLRVNMLWSRAVADDQKHVKTKPAQVNYDWGEYDSLVDFARAYGVKIQLTLTGPAPAWATGSGNAETGYLQPNAKYFGEFARAVAGHFKGRISRYSIWNEPNWKTWLGPLAEGPRLYRDLYRNGYKAIKSVDRKAEVLIGEMSPFKKGSSSTAPLEFLRKVLCVNERYKRTKKTRCPGSRLRADGFAHHPYEFKNPPNVPKKGRDNVTIGALDRLTTALDKLAKARALTHNGGGPMPLYLTEFGYFRAGERKLPEATRQKWTKQGFNIALKNPRVKQILYYVLVSPPGGTFFDLSLLDHTGAETGAYRTLVRWATRNKAKLTQPGPIQDGAKDDPAPPPPEPPPPPGDDDPPPDEDECPIALPEGFPCPFAE